MRKTAVKKRSAVFGKKILLIALILPAIFLSACGVALEDRVFPLSMGVDYQEGKYQVYYGIPDLSGVTGQEKDKGGQNADEEAAAYEGSSMKDAENAFLCSQENYLDTGHVKALLLGPGILGDEKALLGLLEYLEEKPSVSGNIYVFSCDDISGVMALDGSAMESLGNYLTGIVENRPEGKPREQPDLQAFYNAWHNREKWPALQKVSADGDKVTVE